LVLAVLELTAQGITATTAFLVQLQQRVVAAVGHMTLTTLIQAVQVVAALAVQ
jgi:hypothetical protein